MSQPDSRQTLALVAGELGAIGQRLTELSAMVQAQTAEPRPSDVDSPAASGTAEPEAAHPDAATDAELGAVPGAAAATAAPEPSAQERVDPARPSTFDGREPSFRWDRRRDPTARWEPSRVLAWVGSAVTLLGVVFLLVLAVQRGWLGPQLRAGGGAALGLLLVASGWWSHRRPGGRAGGYALAATGFAVLYLDVVAATTLYRYLPTTAGLGAGLAVAIAGLVLADRWRAQPLALGVVLGCAICAPLVAQEPDAGLVAFLLLLQIAAAPSQLRHDWRGLAVAAALPAVLAAAIGDLWALQLSGDSAAVWAAGATAVVGVALATATATVRTGDDATAVGTLVAAPAPALLAAPLLDRNGAGALATGVAVLLFGVWASARFLPALRERLSERMRIAAGTVGAVAALQATMTFVDVSAWGTVLLCEALLLAVGAHQLRSRAALLSATVYAAIGFFAAQFHEIPPAVLLVGNQGGANVPGISGVLAGLLVAVVALVLALVGLRLEAIPRLPGGRPLWTVVGVLLLYGTASATMALVLMVRADRTAFLFGHTLITLSWVVFAIVLLLRGMRAAHLRVAGLVLTAVSLAKLFLFDLGTLDGVARVIAFLCAGLVLLAAGVRYARLVPGGENSADQESAQG